MARAARYDLDDLVEAGLGVVRRSGFTSISVRSVAAAIGVSPMALYRLISDAEELKAVIAEAAARNLRPDGTHLSQDVLRQWAERAYATLSEHPGLAAYVLAHWTDLAGWLAIVDSLLALAANDGVAGPIAVARVNAVFAFVLSRAQLREARTSRTLQLLDDATGRFPFVRANRDQFVTAEADRHFTFGLTALLAGLEAISGTEIARS